MNQRKMLSVVIGIILVCSLSLGQGIRQWVDTLYQPQGTYGLTYNTTNNRIYVTNINTRTIEIVSSDSLHTRYGTIPTPMGDTGYTDIKYCAYDNTFWVLSLKNKMVYKVNPTGTVLRSFNSPATDYPVGLAWDNATRTMYVSDRRTTGGTFPAYIYVCDTLGNTIRRMDHPIRAWFGPRCLSFAPQSGSRPAMLLNAYTFFNSSSLLDSAGVFALDPLTARVINFFRYRPTDTCNIRGVEYDPRNTSYWVGLYQYGT